MNTELRVISAGLTFLQDPGRGGSERLGVPKAGVFDPNAHAALSALFDVPLQQLQVVEHLAGAFTVRNTSHKRVVFAVLGGTRCDVGSQRQSVGTVTQLLPNDSLTVFAASGSPAWIAFLGLTGDPVLGSVSYDSLSRLGPPPLQPGDVLRISRAESRGAELLGRFLRPSVIPQSRPRELTLRFLAGPHLPPRTLSGQEWLVTAVSRSGVRLNTPADPAPVGAGDMVSVPVVPGVVQVPPGGAPLILGPDSGVTGGYPIAGVVASVDLGLLAWAQPGTALRFREVTVDEAARAFEDWAAELRKAVVNLAFLG